MSKRELCKLTRTADGEGSRRKRWRALPGSSSEVDVTISEAGEENLFENGDSRHGEGCWDLTCLGPLRRQKPKSEFRRFC